MAELKTSRNDDSVEAFLAEVPDPGRRADAVAVCSLMGAVTGAPPAMWGVGIVGFGSRRLRYDSGRELDWFVIGFSPRRQALTIYLPDDLDVYADLFARLGKHTVSKSCLYVKRLGDVDGAVLEQVLRRAVDHAAD
ncbi:DUF1801 domain-containing protein [Jiangella mangrovi]|uniref:DUF1801 domain-containing protein n=1 Tax=Jiangella mangrovi TaxID=1524084 RepID=A0A7W9LJQ3_9ACTN|nr:DUF1801 domain-containing protein [Jiangella mangrovi]MBB5786269.1 hypothetical protein [Jiangella mangrovi]